MHMESGSQGQKQGSPKGLVSGQDYLTPHVPVFQVNGSQTRLPWLDLLHVLGHHSPGGLCPLHGLS